MENLINDICQKTGIDRATEKVAGYLKDNMTRKVGDVMGRQA